MDWRRRDRGAANQGSPPESGGAGRPPRPVVVSGWRAAKSSKKDSCRSQNPPINDLEKCRGTNEGAGEQRLVASGEWLVFAADCLPPSACCPSGVRTIEPSGHRIIGSFFVLWDGRWISSCSDFNPPIDDAGKCVTEAAKTGARGKSRASGIGGQCQSSAPRRFGAEGQSKVKSAKHSSGRAAATRNPGPDTTSDRRARRP